MQSVHNFDNNRDIEIALYCILYIYLLFSIIHYILIALKNH